MADVFLGRAKAFIDNHQPSKTGKPFFLYYALHEPHVPRVPHARFVGKSGMGPRGDAILEADWCVGEIIKKLEKDGLLENTLVIFSSDNGPVLDDGYFDDAAEKLGNHTPAGGLRGGKYSLYEAGTRVPFITYWKGKIKPAVSDAMLCQLDFASSFAQLVGAESYSTDSQNLLNVMLGKSKQGRTNLVLEASGRLAFREGNLVMIPPYKGPAVSKEERIELGNASEYQLYDLSNDLAQKNNLAKQFPQKIEEMKASMKKIAGNKVKFD
jgi:arylsulfatase A-like enzyme